MSILMCAMSLTTIIDLWYYVEMGYVLILYLIKCIGYGGNNSQ